MTTLNTKYLTLFTRLISAAVFNAYRLDQSRAEITMKRVGLQPDVMRNFALLCAFVPVEEIAAHDEELGRAAKMTQDGYRAWWDERMYGASEEEILDHAPNATREDYEEDIYEAVRQSRTWESAEVAVEHFNRKRPLYGKD